MESKIRVLSGVTINQIAAGEVVENPASVVKELVENAIDAGASHVKIETTGGGFQFLKISDDGSGMSPDDAALCLERHATSKIADVEDLLSLATMGFRGEALSSIASISKLRLITALESATAIELGVEGGKVISANPAARSRGTTIEVRSLFFNVPARKKFQKSPAASSAEITKIVTQLALAHPEVGFDLTQQNRLHFSLPASAGEDFLTLLKKRAEVLLAADFLPSCHDLTFKEKEYAGKGCIADPLFSRYNRSGQYLFVNQRPVFCPAITYAMRDAYGTRLSSDRHPVYLLHLQIPSHLVDVNVHPQKKEIRLREEGLLKYILHSAVNAALGGKEPVFAQGSATLSSFFTQPGTFDFSSSFSFKEEASAPPPALALGLSPQLIGLYGSYALFSAESLPFLSQGVAWVDLPAAESRIHYDALLKRAQKQPLSQGLLIPLAMSFSKAESQVLCDHLSNIQSLGIQLRQVGAAFLIEGIPPFLNEGEVERVLRDFLGELQGLEREKTQEEEILQRLASSLSRKSRFARGFYSQDEARFIVQKLVQTEDPLHCPQGKRTLFHIKEDEIESYFSSESLAKAAASAKKGRA